MIVLLYFISVTLCLQEISGMLNAFSIRIILCVHCLIRDSDQNLTKHDEIVCFSLIIRGETARVWVIIFLYTWTFSRILSSVSRHTSYRTVIYFTERE